MSLTELRQVKDHKEAAALESARALAKLAPPLSLPAAGSVNTTLSPEQAEMLDFAMSTLRPRTKPVVSPGILVGAHCEASVRALSLQLVAGATCRKVLWVSKSPSALASGLRTTFEPVGGFTTHSFNSAPRSEGVGIALHGGAICLSYAQLVAMHKATHTPPSASDSAETVTAPTSSPLDHGPFLPGAALRRQASARHLLRWLQGDGSEVLLVFSSCDEVLSRSWKAVEGTVKGTGFSAPPGKWTQTGAAMSALQVTITTQPTRLDMP